MVPKEGQGKGLEKQHFHWQCLWFTGPEAKLPPHLPSGGDHRHLPYNQAWTAHLAHSDWQTWPPRIIQSLDLPAQTPGKNVLSPVGFRSTNNNGRGSREVHQLVSQGVALGPPSILHEVSCPIGLWCPPKPGHPAHFGTGRDKLHQGGEQLWTLANTQTGGCFLWVAANKSNFTRFDPQSLFTGCSRSARDQYVNVIMCSSTLRAHKTIRFPAEWVLKSFVFLPCPAQLFLFVFILSIKWNWSASLRDMQSFLQKLRAAHRCQPSQTCLEQVSILFLLETY